MKEYSLGPVDLNSWDMLSIYDIPIEWIVYYYDLILNGFEGHGWAIWKVDDKFGLHNLGHCSCYGPIEYPMGRLMSLGDVLQEIRPISEDDYDYTAAKAVYEKVRTLMGVEDDG